MTRFDSHREQLGRNIVRHSERLYINCLQTSDGVLMEYRITGSVDTTESGMDSTGVVGFMCQLLAEFNNACADRLEEREQRKAARDEDDYYDDYGIPHDDD